MIKDNIIPKEKWDFDKEVSEVFDNMLERSIPQYDIMRKSVFDIGEQFLNDGDCIVDIGASRGNAICPFIEKHKHKNKYICIEKSKPMLDILRDRFKKIDDNILSIRELDLKHKFIKNIKAKVVLSVLTLMFIPLEYRQQVVSNVYDTLNSGGAFIVVDKVIGNTSQIDDIFTILYNNKKQKSGYSLEDIERKRLSLEGVLMPITAEWNNDLLLSAGFKYVECFWRWMNFGGWIGIK